MAKNIIKLGDFVRNTYEMVFVLFLAMLAYLYRYNEHIEYPGILYWFFLLIVFNFAVNRLIKKKRIINLWIIELLLAVNVLIIAAIISSSGGAGSYFWVLYFLPLFTASFLVNVPKLVLILVFIISTLVFFHFSGEITDIQVLVFSIKSALFMLFAGILYKVASVNRRLEQSMAEKRQRIAELTDKIIEKEYSVAEMSSFKQVGEIFSGLVHDLGNILSVILLTSEIMEKTGRMYAADIRKIINATQLAKKLLMEVKSVVKGGRYEFALFQVEDLLRKAVDIVSPEAEEKRIEIRIDSDKTAKVKASEIYFQRVIINCLLNSISFMKEGGEIKIVTHQEEENIFIKIIDEGPGFSPEILAEGIMPFKTTRKKKGGTGLGLYISKEIITRHGGELSLSNREDGKGAVVTIKLPQISGKEGK